MRSIDTRKEQAKTHFLFLCDLRFCVSDGACSHTQMCGAPQCGTHSMTTRLTQQQCVHAHSDSMQAQQAKTHFLFLCDSRFCVSDGACSHTQMCGAPQCGKHSMTTRLTQQQCVHAHSDSMQALQAKTHFLFLCDSRFV